MTKNEIKALIKDLFAKQPKNECKHGYHCTCVADKRDAENYSNWRNAKYQAEIKLKKFAKS